MKIQRPKKFRIGRTAEEIIQYLEVYLASTLSDITTVLQKLTFKDNFKSFEATVTLTAGQELAIQHNLGVVPTGRLILKSTSYEIRDGDTAWTSEYIYLKNDGASSVTLTVVILR
jgi:hypothetical protein